MQSGGGGGGGGGGGPSTATLLLFTTLTVGIAIGYSSSNPIYVAEWQAYGMAFEPCPAQPVCHAVRRVIAVIVSEAEVVDSDPRTMSYDGVDGDVLMNMEPSVSHGSSWFVVGDGWGHDSAARGDRCGFRC